MISAQTLIVMLALIAANLPFATQRIFFLGPLPPNHGDKSLLWRMAELIVLYFLVGAAGAWFELRAHGDIYRQDWQFYAVTASLFLVFAYPGFVVRYLWHRHKG
jgi:hypothetical protein